MQYFISDDRMIEFVVTEDITKEFGLHNHTGHYVISFITKGKATVFYNNVSVVLAKGDTFIIRPYMPHSVAVESGSQILSMCIKKDLFSAQSFAYSAGMTPFPGLSVLSVVSGSFSFGSNSGLIK